jgi:glycosyltransferase involved in cell wall biosynthesis
VIPDQSGLLFEPGAVDSFAAALLRLVDDAALRSDLAAGARRLAQQRSWETILDRVIDTYAELSRGTSARAA